MIPESPGPERAFDPSLLLRAAAFPHPADSLELLETHISWVVLTGTCAYKIKKPVQLPFVDYSTLERRKHFCELELELNRELAPDIYLDVVTINGPPSCPTISGSGEVLDYAVQMNEFDQADILAHRLQQGQVTATEIDRLTDLIASFHKRIPRAGADQPFGTAERIRHEALDNFSAFRSQADASAASGPDEWSGALSPKTREQLLQMRSWTEVEFQRCREAMSRRRASGMVRRCHGDMHAGNIVLFRGRTEIFDRIEFNEDFQWTDCMSELAFPVMDLQHHRRPDLANRLLAGYLEQTGDYDGMRVFRFYLVYRAMVRAKVDWIRQQQTFLSGDTTDQGFVSHLVELALELSQRSSQFLYITHGLSGSGKSTAAMNCVEATGAIRIRSDVERNRMGEASQSANEKYSPGAKSRVYDGMLETAGQILDAGFSVVADATFLNQTDRSKFRDLADQLEIPFGVIDCKAPVAELERRIRERKGDVSEATVAVLHDQIKTADPLTPDEIAGRVNRFSVNS